ncbi:MAG: hypothetical protein L6R41_004195 [Letrouitia leprolyta]|nr:MAG: hypothetical protein L6R41_004195 [Letrouitia leprolyta]
MATNPNHAAIAAESNATSKAHAFELTYRAHPSVAQDPFYAIPPNASDAIPGTLLKVERETNTSLYTLAPTLSMSRFMYQSKTSSGRFVPVSAYILWPYIARDYGPGVPLLAWAHGTSGSNDECAPSNIQNLWHHFQAPYNLALQGYAVVATDYAGLGISKDLSGNFIVHEYLNAIAQANDVRYSIPAARKAFPELSAKFVVIGSSEGGQAAWGFAEKLVAEPMEGHLGTVALSPVTSLLALPESEAVVPLLLLMLSPSLQTNYPNFKPEQIFTSQGQQSLQTYVGLKGCNTVLFNVPSTGIMRDGWQENAAIQSWQKTAGVGGKPISGPMLVIQGGIDPIVYPPTVTDAVNRTIAVDGSASIQFHMLPNVSHAPAMYGGLQIYLDWIAARFSGQVLDSGLSRYDPQPVRPASSLQIEANWFIQNVTAPWQAT